MFKSKTPLERAMDAVLGHELRKLNTHLPKRRRTLTDLLQSNDDQTVEAADGSSIILKRTDLEGLAAVIPREYQDRVKLPIVILRRMELGKSIYTVAGDKIEEFTVGKILSITTEDYRQMPKDPETVFIYRPQVTELLQKFHSLFVIAFGIPRELSDYAPSRD